jgi:16S rRNA (cytosine967-C5)-methyltransferase
MQEIKIHQPIIDAVIVCLKAVFEEGKVADKEVSFLLKQHKNFGSRDRSMIAESVYDIVRWKYKYTHQLEMYNPAFSKYKHLLLVSLLNRKYSIKNPELFEVTPEEINALTKVTEQTIPVKHIEQSYPEDFYTFCLDSIGEKWHELAKALNQKPSVFIRVNALKMPLLNGQCSTDAFIELVKKENIEASRNWY